MIVDLIAGARPNFMKIAPMVDAFKAATDRGGPLRFRLIHTGQHYDKAMSDTFFEQLGIPEPDINLGVGSGTQAAQAGNIMTGYEKVLLEEKSSACVVVGDVTSTMACAIVAQKEGVPVAHVEGGIRSGDWKMPEEINRLVTDSITNWFFTTSEVANDNLRKAGVEDDRIFFVGNTMIANLMRQMPNLRPAPVWNELGLEGQRYFVLTLHRPANVDEGGILAAKMAAVAEGTRGCPVIFPVHPRTRKSLEADLPDSIHCVEPMSYLEFNHLVKHAFGVITDSGGITEEATVMKVPCMTLRDTTERPETIDMGTNVLVGTDPTALKPYLDQLFDEGWKEGKVPPLWDADVAVRIVSKLEELLQAN